MKILLASVLAVLAPMSASVHAQSLTFASGAPKKGFSKIFANINAVCGEKVPLKELNTAGGMDNLGELASKGAHLGLVGVDVFQSMEKTDDAIGRLKAVMSLNTDLLHILVLQSGYQIESGSRCTGKQIMGKCVGGSWEPVYQTKIIQNDGDLKGLAVAAVGSAQVVARRYLNSKMNLGLNIFDVETDAEAQADLKSGKVKAVLTLAAFPCGPISSLKQNDGFALANWESPVSGVYKTSKKNYKNIGSFGVNFLSSQIILMARPVDPNGEIGQKITLLKACIVSNLGRLKEGEEYEPSWSDVASTSVPDDIPAWSGVSRSAKKN